jgi:hypothetical protein
MNPYEQEVFKSFSQKVESILNSNGVKCRKSRISYRQMIFNQLLLTPENYEHIIENGKLKKERLKKRDKIYII